MIHPAYLYIGPHKELIEQTISFIKKHICKNAGCLTCIDCTKIDKRQHHALLWITPENSYTLATIEGVMHTIVYALQPDEHFFIVFEHAELFNIACANSLLKSLEEPPRGYHFMLLAERTEGILATIRSRCIVETFSSNAEQEKHPLLDYFTPVTMTKAAEFIKELDRARMPEREVQPFLDALTDYWYTKLCAAYEKNDENEAKKMQKILAILENARTFPVMPGSSKIFLKNLYLCLSIAF